jgi:hypothetical protein
VQLKQFLVLKSLAMACEAVSHCYVYWLSAAGCCLQKNHFMGTQQKSHLSGAAASPKKIKRDPLLTLHHFTVAEETTANR